MVLYFTGTGNSRYIAQQLATQLKDTLVDITQYIKEQKTPHFESDTPYIFVSPVYAWRLPRVLEQWIQQCTFQNNPQAYFVLTCGDSMGVADHYIQKLAHKKSFRYMGTAQVIMPENYLVMFTPPPKKEWNTIIEKAEQVTAAFSQQIASHLPFEKKKATLVDHLCSHIVTPFFYRFYIGAKKFYTTDQCIACGQCANSCILNNITLTKGTPTWGNRCTHCMACISQCPTKAIEYGKQTKGRIRYFCPK